MCHKSFGFGSSYLTHLLGLCFLIFGTILLCRIKTFSICLCEILNPLEFSILSIWHAPYRCLSRISRIIFSIFGLRIISGGPVLWSLRPSQPSWLKVLTRFWTVRGVTYWERAIFDVEIPFEYCFTIQILFLYESLYIMYHQRWYIRCEIKTW